MDQQDNRTKFKETLTKHYTDLFQNNPAYLYSRQHTTPEAMAERLTTGLVNRRANKDGEGIRRTCLELGIKHTYREIEYYLNQQNQSA